MADKGPVWQRLVEEHGLQAGAAGGAPLLPAPSGLLLRQPCMVGLCASLPGEPAPGPALARPRSPPPTPLLCSTPQATPYEQLATWTFAGALLGRRGVQGRSLLLPGCSCPTAAAAGRAAACAHASPTAPAPAAPPTHPPPLCLPPPHPDFVFNFPGSWFSTVNALRRTGFHAMHRDSDASLRALFADLRQQRVIP